MQPTHAASRHPLVGFLLGLCVVTGVVQIAFGAQPGSIQEQLDITMQVFWSALLAGGALLALVGIWWRGSSLKLALELESLGMTCLAVAGIVYAGAIVLVAQAEGALPAGIVLTFALCCVARRQRIEGVLRPKEPKRGRRGR